MDDLSHFSFTHVFHSRGDNLGALLAYFGLIPFVVLICLATVCVIRRELVSFYFFAGLVASEIVNFILKNLIKELRPEGVPFAKIGYGMPSAHSQFVFFFAVFLLLLFFKWGKLSKLFELSITLFSWIAAILVASGRVYFKYHTVKQVLAGSIVGVFMAFFWFLLYVYVFNELFEKFEDTSLCRYFAITHSEKIRKNSNSLAAYHNSISRKVRGKLLDAHQQNLIENKKIK